MSKQDKKQCWFTPEGIQQMVQGAQAQLNGFKKLEATEHWQFVKKYLKLISEPVYYFVDLGCGAGEACRVAREYGYYTLGADLPHVIEKVAREVNPNANYIDFDIYDEEQTLDFVNDADIVLMNGFIDVLEAADVSLRRILEHCSHYVILHRQTFSDNPTYEIEHSSYGSYTKQSVINRKGFEDLLEELGFEIIQEDVVLLLAHGTHNSVFLRKKK